MTNLKDIAKKWQKRWEEKNIFKAEHNPKKKKFYCLEMYPYPSEKLHMGHLRNYSLGDSLARYKRMQNFNVIYPMGYDSFGLPAENAAIKNKVNPEKWTNENVKAIKKQQKAMGLSYDWSRQLESHLPNYYKWNQWFFLKMYEKGLAYKKKSSVNWCPGCKTVLANEQVENGKCWRCKSDVEQKELEQWFLKIIAYADKLLEDIKKLKDWPERVKLMQENWIGKSRGVNIKLKIDGSDETIETFTTRHDTMFGMTFIVMAPEHPKVMEWVKGTKYEKPTKEFIEKVKKLSLIERTTTEKKKKRGVFLGKYAIHPFNGKKIPIYAADFALLEFGTGIVQAVPAHDQRDFDFAKEYDLPIIVTVQPDAYNIKAEKMSRAYEGHGTLVNSGEFNNMRSEDALEAIANKLGSIGSGKRTTAYKLRDWLISRQRFWGTPIPIIYCNKCGIVAVPEKDLPVLLPKPEKAKFTGSGNPLATVKSFVNTKCPKCNGSAKRETDTMDTFVDSSWYFMRYCSPNYNKRAFDKKEVDYWMPVDQYIGGIEHAIMHLLYARFFTKVLKDMNLVRFDEPFTRLLCQGMVIKDGAKMSKSIGNVVDPAEIFDKYGPDTARLFILFAALPEKELGWSDRGVNGAFKFLNRVYNMSKKVSNIKADNGVLNKMHRTVKAVTENIEKFENNKAVVNLYEYVDYLSSLEKIPKEAFEKLLLLLTPFTPHLCEELWEKLGNKGFISLEKWPKFDIKKISKKIEKEEELIENTISDIRNVLNLVKIEPKKVYLYTIPKEKEIFLEKKNILEKKIGLELSIYAVNDKNIYDPQGKAKKAKPEKPAILIE